MGPANLPVMTVFPGGLGDRRIRLSDVEFVVVDLETTGERAVDAAITEIAAVRVLRGQVLGEFQSLVHPGMAIPPFISRLTGITDQTVRQAPGIGSVLPAFLEFAQGGVLVAHNAPFDLAFLRSAADQLGVPWPEPAVLDTVQLARHLLDPGETTNHKLGTLARLFGSPTAPDHRALADARATVHVLHGLLERVGPLGIDSLEELVAAFPDPPPPRATPVRWADPDRPAGNSPPASPGASP